MQACIHAELLRAEGWHNCRCWQSNALVYNSQGPGSREHIALLGGHATLAARHRASGLIHCRCKGSLAPCPSLTQTLYLLELNLPPSKPSSRQLCLARIGWW